MKKKILALALAFTMLLCAIPSHAYTVREAYDDFVLQYPEFVDGILATNTSGVNEGLIVDFLRDLQRRLYLVNRSTKITEDNLEEHLIDAVNLVSNSNKYIPLQNALYKAYPDAAIDAVVYGHISNELLPLYETVKSMLFTHDMLAAPDRDNEPYVTELTYVFELEPVTVKKGGALSLPQTLEASLRGDSTISIGISWDSVPSTNDEGSFLAEGTLIIPDGYALANGLNDRLSLSVTVVKDDDANTGDNGDNNNNDNNNNDNNNNNNNSGNGGNGGGTGGNGGNGGNVITDPTVPAKHLYSFSDVDELTELGKAVYALSDIGIINGYLDGTFKAENNITRAEFAKIMVVAMESYSADATADFTDMPNTPENWSYSFVASAKKVGLINGYPDGTFKPQANITRAEVMTVIYRALDTKKALKATDKTSPAYDDDASIPEFARTAVYSLTNNGIVSGIKSNNTVGVIFNNILPTKEATRGQCAVMLYNALKAMGKLK